VTFTISSSTETQTVSGVKLTSGQAQTTIANLDAGTYTVTAAYNGDNNFTGNSGTLSSSETVTQTGTTINLQTSMAAAPFGGSAITAAVQPVAPAPGPVSGTVTFTVTDTTAQTPATTYNIALVKGVATLPNLNPDSYSITAAFGGTTDWAASGNSNTITQTIFPFTVMTLNSTNPNSVYGEAQITATVAPPAGGSGTPAGNVQLTVTDLTAHNTVSNYTVPLVSGVATLPALDPDSYSITAAYPGSATFGSSTAGPLSQTVSQAGTTTVASATPGTVNAGDNLTLSATITANSPGQGTPNSGTVTFTVGSGLTAQTFTANVSSGQAQVVVNTLSPGNYPLTAVYTGNTDFSTSTSTNNASLVVASTSQLQLSSLRETYGFYTTGNYYTGEFGLNEKWFKARPGNNNANSNWYAITPAGSIRPWIGGNSLGNPVVWVDSQGVAHPTVDPQVWSNPNLLFQAPVLTATQQNQLALLEQQYGFYTTGNYYPNQFGLNEKWFKARPGNNDANQNWYAITINGTTAIIRPWIGGGSLGNPVSWVDSQGVTQTTVDLVVYDDPNNNLLLSAEKWLTSAQLTPIQTPLTQLRQSYGFYFTGSYYTNKVGQNEKWFKARPGNNDANSNWYAITPDGAIHPYTGSFFGSFLGSAIATVSPLAYDDPNFWLFQAPVTLSQADQNALASVEAAFNFQFRTSYYFNEYGLNEKWIWSVTKQQWYVITTDGTQAVIRPWQPSTNNFGAAIPTATPLNPLAYDDPNTFLFQL
jgi:hypothetical protein